MPQWLFFLRKAMWEANFLSPCMSESMFIFTLTFNYSYGWRVDTTMYHNIPLFPALYLLTESSFVQVVSLFMCPRG